MELSKHLKNEIATLEQTKLPTDLQQRLLPQEIAMWKVKLQAKPFIQMSAKGLDKWVDALMLKIHAITGWVIPDSVVGSVFTDQFRKKIIESYAALNPDEIEYAFRTYGTTVQDWGKNMNLALIDEVLIPYQIKRYELIRRVEDQVSADTFRLPAPESEEMADRAMNDWYQDLIRKISTMDYPLDFIPLPVYAWLDKKQAITATDAEKRAYVEKAVDYRLGQLREAVQNKPTPANENLLTAFKKMINPENGEKKIIKGAEGNRVRNIAKKMLLMDMIKNAVQDTLGTKNATSEEIGG